jgi:hypothetical protein
MAGGVDTDPGIHGGRVEDGDISADDVVRPGGAGLASKDLERRYPFPDRGRRSVLGVRTEPGWITPGRSGIRSGTIEACILTTTH